MRQTGITTDGKPVIGDVFRMVSTHGLPLELILYRFEQTGRVVDWPDYIAGALKDGHKPATVKARILAAVGDVYGSAHAKQVAIRLNVM